MSFPWQQDHFDGFFAVIHKTDTFNNVIHTKPMSDHILMKRAMKIYMKVILRTVTHITMFFSCQEQSLHSKVR